MDIVLGALISTSKRHLKTFNGRHSLSKPYMLVVHMDIWVLESDSVRVLFGPDHSRLENLDSIGT